MMSSGMPVACDALNMLPTMGAVSHRFFRGLPGGLPVGLRAIDGEGLAVCDLEKWSHRGTGCNSADALQKVEKMKVIYNTLEIRYLHLLKENCWKSGP